MTHKEKTMSDIARSNLPVIFFDTCSLLDIIRDPIRKEISPQITDSALKFLSLLQENKLKIIIVPQVIKEIAKHSDRLESETQKSLKKLSKVIQKIDKISVILGNTKTNQIEHWKQYHNQTRDILDKLLQASYTLEENDTIKLAAIQRVTEKIAPAKLGKDSLQDCIVLESMLNFVTQLREQNHTKTILFVTSNTSDFCDPLSKLLHHDLISDFKDLNILFAITLEHALHQLRS